VRREKAGATTSLTWNRGFHLKGFDTKIDYNTRPPPTSPLLLSTYPFPPLSPCSPSALLSLLSSTFHLAKPCHSQPQNTTLPTRGCRVKHLPTHSNARACNDSPSLPSLPPSIPPSSVLKAQWSHCLVLENIYLQGSAQRLPATGALFK
jgi:hypothetical protein